MCISARRFVTASVLQDASCALRFMIFIELGGHIHRRNSLGIASMTADRPAAAAQPWARLELPQ